MRSVAFAGRLALACVLTGPLTAMAEPMVGGDRDEHGCIGSAGYTYSLVRQKCIRLFEEGFALAAKSKSVDQTTAAFVVFPSDADMTKAEVFLPGHPTALLFAMDTNSTSTWGNKSFVLTREAGHYALANVQDEILYQGPAVR